MAFDIDKPFGLEGRVALVTGGGSGLGRQFATVLSAAGARVALCGRRPEPLEETARMIGERGGHAVCATMDVTDEDSMRRALEQVCEEAGVPDILINTAGVNRPKFATELSAADWDLVLDTNLRGCFLLARAFARPEVVGQAEIVCGIRGRGGQRGQVVRKQAREQV